jgi:hypothetical protein
MNLQLTSWCIVRIDVEDCGPITNCVRLNCQVGSRGLHVVVHKTTTIYDRPRAIYEDDCQ